MKNILSKCCEDSAIIMEEVVVPGFLQASSATLPQPPGSSKLILHLARLTWAEKEAQEILEFNCTKFFA
jgi:hypothetical protein